MKAVVEGVEKKLSFRADDVLTKATMLKGDKVQFKISTNPKTRAERAVSLEILPDTFQCTDTEEQRKIVSVMAAMLRCWQWKQMSMQENTLKNQYFQICTFESNT